MAALDWLIRVAQGVRPFQVGAVMAILTLLLAMQNLRLGSLALFVQYGLLSMLTVPYLYPAVALARGVLVMGIAVILSLSAWRTQREMTRLRRGEGKRILFIKGEWRGMGTFFYLAALAIGGLLAYGAWNAYPLALVPRSLALAGYWVAALGLVMSLVGEGPLQRGVGLIFIVSGSESLYLAVERGLLVISLMSLLDVMLALAIVYTTEMWLEAQRGASAL